MYISLNTHNYDNDYEYQRIIQQLLALGIKPSGNKSSDKARLQIEKERLINRAENNKESDTKFLETLVQVQEDSSMKSQMEEERLGATSLAELNRLYFNI